MNLGEVPSNKAYNFSITTMKAQNAEKDIIVLDPTSGASEPDGNGVNSCTLSQPSSA